MTLLYFVTFDRPLAVEIFQTKLQLLGPQEGNKIMRFIRWQDAHASLIGKLMTYKACRDFSLEYSADKIKTSAKGKPFFNGSSVAFNVSHSHNSVACIMTDDTDCVGVDIEDIREIEIGDFHECWTIDERNDIVKGGLKTFYDYWTRKEALVKAVGCGLECPLHSINVRSEQVMMGMRKYYLRKLNLHNGVAAHAAFGDNVDMITKFVYRSAEEFINAFS